jgi:hypothetical protein
VAATLNAGEPHLTGLKILFLTADDDKDDDTGLEVGIEDTTGDVYARGESSRVHFNDQSQHTVKLSVLRPILLNALGSFRLHIHISPRGHDTWRFRYTLSAEKSNGGSYVYSTQAMRPITLDQDHRDEVQLLPSGD